ncbi:MAG TPA: hypothetical protein VG916_07300 [Gemmatimonadaceae bacterium]|nr:hypothetical protein [Gemmatimonadaceae bacterium]
MSAATAVATARPFVTALRTPRGEVVAVGAPGGERVVVRLQFEPLWDAIAMDARTDEPVLTLVREMLARFGEGDAPLGQFVVKLRGWEVADLATTVAASGARAGSTFLVAYRYRRPVR